MARTFEERGWQEEPIGRHHERVRLKCAHALDLGDLAAQGARLHYRDAGSKRELLDRARPGRQAAAGRPSGLRQDKRDLVTSRRYGRERARRKLGRAGED